MKKIIIVLLLLGFVGGLGGWYWRSSGTKPTAFRTVATRRGDLLATIGATGTVEPEEVVDIGAQVAGQIDYFGKDPKDKSGTKTVDYGSEVEKGTVLAHIDEALYEAEVDLANASVGQAVASEQRAEADLQQLKAKLYQSDRDFKRAKQLSPTNAIAPTDYDLAQATFETSKAALAVGEAGIVQSKKAVAQAKATLKKAETNLGYCTIKSPVKGVIVDRRVNIGQTVVSSLNAPSLFLIAKDLKRMQVWASVNEADIGQIHRGQKVLFSVDAYPAQVFNGEVGQIRLNATMTQNVVTYTVEINTDNSSGKLLPYLTANLQFEVAQHHDVLLVPNGALRWSPQARQVAPEARDEFAKSQRRRSGGDQAGPPEKVKKESHDRGTVWIQDGDYVRPVKVRLGLSDGVMTEIQEDTLTEGTEVVIGEIRQNSADSVTNPFAPQLFNNSRR